MAEFGYFESNVQSSQVKTVLNLIKHLLMPISCKEFNTINSENNENIHESDTMSTEIVEVLAKEAGPPEIVEDDEKDDIQDLICEENYLIMESKDFIS
ncbi:MAG: hypothetical protein MHPSP_003111, partial [Paramarteilia canceri]